MKRKILLSTITFILLLLMLKAPSRVDALSSYTLTLDGRGGTINGSSKTNISLSSGTNISNTINSFYVSKSGATFTGWYYDSDGLNPLKSTDSITCNLTLYARYSDDSIKYEIKLNANGGRNYNGSTITTITVNENTNIMNVLSSLNPIDRTGYTFLGWFYDENLLNALPQNQVLTENITLYAGWAEISYSLKWNPNGGYFR